MMRQDALNNWIGRRYGRWVVVEYDNNSKPRHHKFICMCDCGKEKSVAASNLSMGASRSCGCLQKERAKQGHPKHGASKTPIYKLWSSTKQACCNPQNREYHLFGGRGIKLCERWQTFTNFYADVGDIPEGMFFTCIRRDGDFEPGNWQWSPISEQYHHKSNNRIIIFNGVSKTLTQWARETGIARTVIERRLDYLSWSVEDALTIETKKYMLGKLGG